MLDPLSKSLFKFTAAVKFMTDYKVEGKQEPGHAHSKDLNKSDVLNKKAMSVTALSRRLASSFGPAEAALTQNLKSFQHFHHKYMVFRANHLSQVLFPVYSLHCYV